MTEVIQFRAISTHTPLTLTNAISFPHRFDLWVRSIGVMEGKIEDWDHHLPSSGGRMSQETCKLVSLKVLLCPRIMTILLPPHIFTLTSSGISSNKWISWNSFVTNDQNLIQNDFSYKEELISSQSLHPRS